MKLFDNDGWPNFSETDGILSSPANIIMIWGGRGTGKTYTCLKDTLDAGKDLLFLRRTPGQVDTIAADPSMWPFSPINRDTGRLIMPERVKGLRGMYRIMDEQDQDNPRQVGMVSSVVTLGRTRGFSSDTTERIILDEYQKDELDYYRKGEGLGLANIYETVNRNRELKGKEPCKLILMSNAVGMANPYYMQWDVVDIIDKMIGTRRRWMYLPDRGIMLVDLADSPVAERKKDTALYRSLAGTDFYRSALENQYAGEEKSRTESRDLIQYRPVVCVGRLCIYRHKSNDSYYVCEHMSGAAPVYGTGHYDLLRFRQRYARLYGSYMARKIIFERYSDEIYFRQLWDA